MKSSQIFSLSVLILIFLPAFASAQFLKIGAGGGITHLLAPDEYTKEISDGGLGFSTEWNVGLVGKLDIPLIPITPRAFLFYHSFSGSGIPTPELFRMAAADGEVKNSKTVFEIGFGAQYNFIPAPLGFDPYLALDLSYNSFGKMKVNDIEVPDSDASRYGLGIGIGTEVSIVPVINLDLYLCYKMLNLMGKEDNEDTISAVTINAFIIFNFL
jgi:hypothetical protein